MSWRTVAISQRCKLDYKMGNLVVRGDDIKRIRMDEISVLILENTAISVTAYLINEISKRKIKLIFCDEKRNPASELVSIYGSHDCSNKLKRQIQWQGSTKELFWTYIVAEKIRKQYELLIKIEKYSEAEILSNYINELQLNDATNREGHSAKVYFNALFGKSFTRTQDNSINSALNYGYSILLSVINREIVANGYSTKLGIFHDNVFNFFNLSCDLMEPFRIIVDKIVYKLNVNVFESEQKHKLLFELLNYVIYINEHEEFLLNGIKIYCRAMLTALNANEPDNIIFYDFID